MNPPLAELCLVPSSSIPIASLLLPQGPFPARNLTHKTALIFSHRDYSYHSPSRKCPHRPRSHSNERIRRYRDWYRTFNFPASSLDSATRSFTNTSRCYNADFERDARDAPALTVAITISPTISLALVVALLPDQTERGRSAPFEAIFVCVGTSCGGRGSHDARRATAFSAFDSGSVWFV